MSSSSVATKARILCLHGWRTSGRILSMQCAGLRHHTQLDLVTVDAPCTADGPPDPMIGEIYRNLPYYQWYYRHTDAETNAVRFEGVQESIDFLVDIFRTTGPYDGLLGFSQGAAMATMLADRLLQDKHSISPKFVILIGGIEPMQVFAPKEPIDIPSLHIIGRSDHLQHRSHDLMRFYTSAKDSEEKEKENEQSLSEAIADNIKVDGKKTTFYHSEGHQIPSVRTELYPHIKQWVDRFIQHDVVL